MGVFACGRLSNYTLIGGMVMSNKLVKHGMDDRAEAQAREQRAQYACIFAIATRAVQAKGGSMVVSVDEINAANTKLLRFEAVNKDGELFKGNGDDGIAPYGIRAVVEDPMNAPELTPKSLDA